jgi:hypothetical protein
MEGLMYDKRIAGGMNEAQLAAWNAADVRKMRRATGEIPPALWIATWMLPECFGETLAIWYLAPDEIAALEVSPSRTKH